jgi:hypothetical protein
MKTRLLQIPRYSSSEYELPAGLFNRVRLALLRLENPIRFSIPNLRHLDLYLDDEVWAVLDESLNDVPIMAWLDFRVEGRSSLHRPIPCTLYTYHCHAEVIEHHVLESLHDVLELRLQSGDAEQGGHR